MTASFQSLAKLLTTYALFTNSPSLVQASHDENAFAAQSKEQILTTSDGTMSFKYTSGLQQDMPELNGEINIKVPEDAGEEWKFKDGSQSIRVCLEISTPKEFFSDAKERIYWQGTIGSVKFNDPLIMKQGFEIREDEDIKENIDDFWLLCSMPGTGSRHKKYLEQNTQDSGIINVESLILGDPINEARIKFKRNFITNNINTMNLQGDTKYVVYMSWGIFPTEESFENGAQHVKGDIEQGSGAPSLMEFNVLSAPPLKCSGASNFNSLMSLVVLASTVSISTIY